MTILNRTPAKRPDNQRPDRLQNKRKDDHHDDAKRLGPEFQKRPAPEQKVPVRRERVERPEPVDDRGQARDRQELCQERLFVEGRDRARQHDTDQPQHDPAQDLHGPGGLQEDRIVAAGAADDEAFSPKSENI
jgi:hypothetical protein